MNTRLPRFYEFFAGGGMARAGLGAEWECLFANDFDARKVATYVENWGPDEVRCEDIRKLSVAELPSEAELVWGSFPCQDLSLAGGGAGLKGNRSGTFWPFWSLVQGLIADQRQPSLVVLENVCGTLTSHGGGDFIALCDALASAGYSLGALVIDAARFVPQSRPRLFIVAARDDRTNVRELTSAVPLDWCHPKSLVQAHGRLSNAAKERWVWWNLPIPNRRVRSLGELVEAAPNDVRWHDPEETARLIEMMSPLHRRRLQAVQSKRVPTVGTLYRRTRRTETGERVQRAEVRFDQTAGCLRTPAGGSSRQTLIFVAGNHVRTRLVSARETARLMGLPDTYQLPRRYNEAYHLTGDGVAVDVVEYLSKMLLLPLIGKSDQEQMIA